MTTPLDTTLRPIAADLIDDYGTTITWRSVTDVDAEDYNPSTGAVAATTTEYTVKAAVTGFSAHKVNGTSILAGDLQVLFADQGLGFVPSQRDKVVLDSQVYNVVMLTPVYSGDEKAIWKAQVRR